MVVGAEASIPTAVQEGLLRVPMRLDVTFTAGCAHSARSNYFLCPCRNSTCVEMILVALSLNCGAQGNDFAVAARSAMTMWAVVLHAVPTSKHAAANAPHASIIFYPL